MVKESAISRLQEKLGSKISTSQADRALHGQNETYYSDALPDAVAYPESTADVTDILRICHEEDFPVTAYGAASSLEGQHLAISGGVSLDMGRMNNILKLHEEDLCVVVQPGVTRKQLNEDLRASGLFFSVDPGADASLGGMAATRASGTMAVRYGTMRDVVLALEVVGADGRVFRTGSRARKSSTGYDLTHLMIGSEGTLGIITEMTVRLQGIPETIRAATCYFPDVEAAVNCVILTIQSGLPMARIELLDEMMVRGFNTYSGTTLPEKPHLFLEFHGASGAIDQQRAEFGEIAQEFGSDGWQTADSTEARNRLWDMRHKAHYASGALAPKKQIWPTDICVPISRLAEAVTWAQDEAKKLDFIATIVGHVGDGNFHVAISVDPGDSEEMDRAAQYTRQLSEIALALDGTVSGEHGIGLGKQVFMEAEHGAALDVMRVLKNSLDPKNILNPGKMLPTASEGKS